jgi:hypothetical protein
MARDLPGPPTSAGHTWAARGLRAWAPRARMHALVPLVAAAGVAVIIVTAIVVVPRLLAGPAGGLPGGALAGAPRFFAGVAENPPGHPPSTVVNIYRSATGRVVGSVRLPRHLRMFAAVGRLGSDRTYAAAAVTRNGCTTRLYRFTIDARGRPSGLTSLSVPQVTGAVGELVGSADGKAAAPSSAGRVSAGRCSVMTGGGGYLGWPSAPWNNEIALVGAEYASEGPRAEGARY